MGYCAQKANVLLLLASMEKVLHEQGARVAPGAGVAAAIQNYAGAEAAVAVSKA
jgi:aspartate aminotransferase-like enzyme